MKFAQYLEKYEIVDVGALNQYIEFISDHIKKPICEEVYSERHHILPKSMFPEFSNETWNIVLLKYEDHIEAHRLLHLIYRSDSMNYAYFKMKSTLTNYNQLPETREKIRQSKLGKARPDLHGKAYFGASKERYEAGIEKMKAKLKNTVAVKDADGNYFRVSTSDPRYISGELVPFNKGLSCPNNGCANRDVLKKVLDARNAKYAIVSTYNENEMDEHIFNSYFNGKTIFSKYGNLHSNYSRLVLSAGLDKSEILELVVQRLGLTSVGSSDSKRRDSQNY